MTKGNVALSASSSECVTMKSAFSIPFTPSF
jgi:hypothetical protein